MSETPDSEYADMSVSDEDLPEDLQPGEDNPLAEGADDDGSLEGDDRQDMGDPHIPGLQRDDDGLSMPDAGDEEDDETDRAGDGES